MKKFTIFILWDEKDGYSARRVYLDKKSAEIALQENYTEYWIANEKAKVMPIDAVSYIK
jgi:hypothetical protein